MSDIRSEQDAATRLKAEGLTRREIGERLGISEHAVKRRLAGARRRESIDPAIQNSMGAVGTGMVPALAWAKTKEDENGLSYSVLLKPQEADAEDFLEQVSEAFADIPAAPKVTAPRHVNADLCTVYPLMDVHFGMLAWGQETGSQASTMS